MPTEVVMPTADVHYARLAGIYNLNGQFLGTDSKPLRRGIYIQRTANGQYHKMMVK